MNGTRDGFDPEKDAKNREKHGLPLTFGNRILDDPNHLITPTIRAEDREDRYKVIGEVDGKIYTGVFVWRDDQQRYISVRRSNAGEEKAYRNQS